MNIFARAALILTIFLSAVGCLAQGILTPVAGSDFVFPRQGVAALQAPLGRLAGVAVDAAGNVFAIDVWNNIIVKIAPDGRLTVVAGSGQDGSTGDGGPALAAALSYPTSIVVDGSGNLYLMEPRKIRVVDAQGIIRTAVTLSGTGRYSPLAIDAQGRIYVASSSPGSGPCFVTRFGPEGATNIAGNGTCGFSTDGGVATAVPLTEPIAVAVDPAGNVYITEDFSEGERVRKVGLNGIISTVAAPIHGAVTAADAAGNLYGSWVHSVFKVDSRGVTSTLAGGLLPGFGGDGGLATNGRLYAPDAVALDSAGNLYIADTSNYRVRRIRAGALPIIETVAGNGRFRSGGDGGSALAATLFGPSSMVVDQQGNLLFTEPGSHRIRRIDSQGQISTFAGANAGFSGDGVPAASATFLSPSGLAFDRDGNLYVADTRNDRVRRIGRDGIVTTVAGGGTKVVDEGGEGGPATQIALYGPSLVAVDPLGNLLIVDQRMALKVSPQGIVTRHPFLGPGFSGFSGTNAIAIDPAGVTYVATYSISARFDCLGNLKRFQADGSSTMLIDRVCPTGLALDSLGNVFMSTSGLVQRVSRDGTVAPVANFDASCNAVPSAGSGTSCSFVNPGALAVDSRGNLLIAGAYKIHSVPPCNFSLSPAAVTVPASGGTSGLQVNATPVCAWQARSDASWIGLTSTRQATGPGSLFLSFADNTSAAPRTGTISVAGQTFTVTQAGAGAPSLTAFEPTVTLRLPAGFYIAEATLAPGARGGFWGLEVLTSLGQAAGGFNLGGGLHPGSAYPGFGAFLLSEPQKVTATLNGFLPEGAQFTMRLLSSNRQVIGTPVTGVPPLTLSQDLQPGFYIVEVANNGTVPANYLLGLAATFFAGGVDTGGYLGPGITGFGAFYVPVEQDVTLHVFGRNTYGSAGAESVILTLRDSDRKVLRVISAP